MAASPLHPYNEAVGICTHCGGDFVHKNQVGPKAKYCSATCRQRAYEARRLEKDTVLSAAAAIKAQFVAIRLANALHQLHGETHNLNQCAARDCGYLALLGLPDIEELLINKEHQA
jgi:hypothetical protein